MKKLPRYVTKKQVELFISRHLMNINSNQLIDNLESVLNDIN